MPKPPEKNKLSVTILGSGTCVPSLERSACSVLIGIENNYILLDAGPGTMRRLLEAGVTVFDISHLFFSHLHPDHSGEIVSFLFANKYPDQTRRQKPLSMGAGVGFFNFFKQLKSIYKEWIDVGGRLELIEFDNVHKESYAFEGFRITTSGVAHSPESVAYRITAPDGTCVVYSGDTDMCESLIDLSQNADLLICESALPDPIKVDGHLTPSYAGRVATAANVKKLVLTHFYPECDQADIRQQCRTTYAGPLILAKDLLTVQLDE